MRNEKNEKFKELKHKRNTAEYEYYFLRYIPSEKTKTIKQKTKTKTKTKSKTKKAKI